MTLQVEVDVQVGYTDGREPSDADKAYGRRLGPFVKGGAEASAALEACPVSETPVKYPINPPLEGGFVLLVTVEVNRASAGVALWNVIEAAKTALDTEIAQTFHEANSELLQTTADLRGLRPATSNDACSVEIPWRVSRPEEFRQS